MYSFGLKTTLYFSSLKMYGEINASVPESSVKHSGPLFSDRGRGCVETSDVLGKREEERSTNGQMRQTLSTLSCCSSKASPTEPDGDVI